MRVDIDKPGLDLGDPVRVGRGLRFLKQRMPLPVSCKNDFEQIFRSGRSFLKQAPDLGAGTHAQ